MRGGKQGGWGTGVSELAGVDRQRRWEQVRRAWRKATKGGALGAEGMVEGTRAHSAQGLCKPFSHAAPHLAVVSLMYSVPREAVSRMVAVPLLTPSTPVRYLGGLMGAQ